MPDAIFEVVPLTNQCLFFTKVYKQQIQGHSFSMFGGCQRFCPAKMGPIISELATVFSVICFLTNSSWSGGPGSSKLPCKNTLCCLSRPAKWKIFKVRGGHPSPYLLSFVPEQSILAQ